MKNWVFKALIQKIISFLPYSDKINFWFQKHITKGVLLSEEHFNDKLSPCFDHITYCKNEKEITNSTILEIGTGWYPVIPLGFYLSGSTKIYSIDISPLCNKERLLNTIDKFIEWRKRGSLDIYLNHIEESRWKSLTNINRDLSFSDLLKILNINLIVGDARKLPLIDGAFDFVISNNVFEHIYPQILKPIIKECNRILKPNGVHSHFIDMSDHFAHNDDKINIYNFLKYSDSEWNLIDNSVQPQSRERLPFYLELMQNENLNTQTFNIRKGSLEILKKMKINHKFIKNDIELIAISHAHLLSKKI